MPNHLEKVLRESMLVKNSLTEDQELLKAFDKAAEVITRSLKNGNKLLIAGNGGSAADAQHFSAELTGRYIKERRGLPAIALATDTSFITAWANDYSYDTIYARALNAFGTEGDVFVGISTSGNSKNIIEAAIYARKNKIPSIGLLGKDGGKLKDLMDIPLIVKSTTTARVQECHILIIHALCDMIETSF